MKNIVCMSFVPKKQYGIAQQSARREEQMDSMQQILGLCARFNYKQIYVKKKIISKIILLLPDCYGIVT